jgi:hypothetical protein
MYLGAQEMQHKTFRIKTGCSWQCARRDLNKKLFESKSPRPWIVYGKTDGGLKLLKKKEIDE